MTIQELLLPLNESYGDDILETAVHNENECYLSVSPRKIKEICGFLDESLSCALISMFAADERAVRGHFVIYYTFAERKSGQLMVLLLAVSPSDRSFPSISKKIPAAARYEREILDLFGLVPIGHPNPKRLVFHGNWPSSTYPLRKDFPADQRPEFAKNADEFQTITGNGVYEIPVGPVHAGIIEPGHFRFSLAGEPILNLEAQLFYVHKGIEKLSEGKSTEHCFYLSERISGDETFTNSLAYCQAIEKIGNCSVPVRAKYMRVLFAELERLTAHLGDLAGICLDVAYGFGAYQFRMMRGWAYRIADELCGMRFLRSVNKPGGVRKDFLNGKENSILEQLNAIKKELEDTIEIVMRNSLLIDRIENTGILNMKIASDLNAVGPGGRASGICHDVRTSFPYAAYSRLKFKVPVFKDGDVSSRMKVKLAECFESISLMNQAIEGMPTGSVLAEPGLLKPGCCAYGMTEAPRGENVHFIMIGESQTVSRYKIRTPSYCNWPALCFAVQGNIVPDFPLINKSFNLSYAGNDL